jgi:hypothetical protein
MENKNKRSDGEELIEEYLDAEDIHFKPEVKINNLKGDKFPYRKADFYLTQYKVYVEFLGRWNVESNRKEYKEKMRIYKENNIPCVYLYPDNLGILNFIFKRRLKKELKKHDMKWQLIKVNWSLFQEKYGLGILFFIVLFFLIDDLSLKIIVGLLVIYGIMIGLKSTFFK